MSKVQTMAVEVGGVTVKVSDYFYASWGYDQTNVQFYRVVGFTPSGKSVKLQEVAAVAAAGGVVPGTATVGPVETKRFSVGFSRPAVSFNSYKGGYLWDGTPKYDTRAAGQMGH